MMSAVVLLVDDEPAIRTVVRRVLTPRGFRIVEATDGRAALELAAAEVPDLVLTDLNMPLMSGEDLVRALRNDVKLAQVPILAMSGGSGSTGLPGDVPVIQKPFSTSCLLDTVLSMLGGAPREVRPSPASEVRLAVRPPTSRAVGGTR